jgi:hypothetical protein
MGARKSIRGLSKYLLFGAILVLTSSSVLAGSNFKLKLYLHSDQKEVELGGLLVFQITIVNEDEFEIAIDTNQIDRYIFVDAVLELTIEELKDNIVSDSIRIVRDRFCNREKWRVLKPGDKYTIESSIKIGDTDFYKVGSRYSLYLESNNANKIEEKNCKTFIGELKSNKILFTVKPKIADIERSN